MNNTNGFWSFAIALLLMGGSMAATGCDIPRDPNGSLERIQGGTLRVGVSEQPPWVIRTSGEPSGAEAVLVKSLARRLGARVEWHWGSVEDHLEALERYELDLVVAGLVQTTPWGKKIGLTKPYYIDTLLVGVPPRAPVPPDLSGLQVFVEQGSSNAAFLISRDARPVRVADLRRARGPVAASRWELATLGLHRTEHVLHQEKHVMAVPPGENGWLMFLERFLLRTTTPEIEALLRREVGS